MRCLLADVQRGADLGPRRTLFPADPHHLGDPLCHHHFQGVEPFKNVQFPDPAIDRGFPYDVQLEPPYRFGR
jgi:hypothetical protein